MRAIGMALVLGVVLGLAGCVPSLHPFYSAKDVIYDPALVGTWSAEENKETWKFEKGEGKTYMLTYTSEGEPGEFDAHLMRLGKHTFLDIFPRPRDPEPKNALYAVGFVPAHLLLQVRSAKDSLRLALMDADWIKDALSRKKIKVTHDVVEDAIILTAHTPELREFVMKCADDPKAFPNWGEVQRQK